MYKYSIIIPHYNIPHLLERCISSIPQRDDIQIIVVDDCTPESDIFAGTVNRIKLRKGLLYFKTEQGGSAGRARNIGLEHAEGEWLIFADADDFFDESLSHILDKYADCDDDVIFFNYRSVMSDDISKPSDRKNDYDPFSDHASATDESFFRFSFHVPWCKMVRRTLVERNNIRFDETRYANDAMFSVLVGCKAGNIKIVDIPAYVLTERGDSLCSNFCQKKGEAAIRAKVALRVHKVISDHGFHIEGEYPAFIKTLLWNEEYSDLYDIYHSIADYGLEKSEIRRIIKSAGRRYYPISWWLVLSDIIRK